MASIIENYHEAVLKVQKMIGEVTGVVPKEFEARSIVDAVVMAVKIHG